MLISLNELIGYSIKAIDDEIGKVNDFLFDDQKYTIRYLVADTGNWLIDRLVLLSPNALEQTDWTERLMPIRLTKKQIEESPKIEKDKPVSRQNESKLAEYYGWPIYWGGLGFGPYAASVPPVVPPKKTEIKSDSKNDSGDPNLRSAKEIMNYAIGAVDGDIGHVDDVIVDYENQKIIYIVIDTHDILPWSKKVLCNIDWIENIDYFKSKVDVDLTIEAIKDSPEFNPSEPINREYEERLYDYYGRPKYWVN